MLINLISVYKRNKYLFLLGFITLLGLIIRLYGINFGKPYLYHIDEWKLVNQAGKLLDIKNFSHEVLFGLGTYPPFFTYILTIAFGIFGMIGLIFGFFSSPSDIVEYYKVNPFMFHYIGRWISVLMGTATIPLLYLIGKNLYNKKVGTVAAAFLTFLFIHVRNSHYSTVDIPATFFVILAFYYITMIFLKDKNKYYILAGIFSSLAIATKYNVLFIVAPLGLVFLFLNFRRKSFFKNVILNKKLGLMIITVILIFAIACPLILVDISEFLPQVQQEVNSQKSGKIGFSGEGFFSYVTGKQWKGFGFTSRNSLAGAMSIHLMLLSLLGFIFCALRHKKQDLLLISFPILLYILHGNMSYKAMRHILPAIPFLVIMAAILLDVLISKIPVHKKYKLIFIILISVIIIIPLSIDALQLDYKLTQKDTRTIAAEWVEQNIPSDSKIAVEFYPPQVYNTNKDFSIIGPRLIVGSDSSFKYLKKYKKELKKYVYYNTKYLDFFWGPDRIVENGPVEIIKTNKLEYVILDSWTSDRYYKQSVKQNFPVLSKQRRDFYNWVEENCTLLSVFAPTGKTIPGPKIKIYIVNNIDP